METKDIAKKLRLRPMTKSKGYTFIKYGGLISRYRFYVICSAGNSTLVKAIADNIEDKLAEAGVHPTHKEGYADGTLYCWITVMLLLTFSWRKNAIFII